MADQSGVTPVTKPSDETPCASKDASDPVIASERLDQDTGTGIQDRAPRVWNTGALPAPEDAQKAEGGVREPLSVRLVRAAHDVLGNDTKHVLDCSTGEAIAAVLRELADRGDYVEFALNPQGYIRELADEIEEKR